MKNLKKYHLSLVEKNIIILTSTPIYRRLYLHYISNIRLYINISQKKSQSKYAYSEDMHIKRKLLEVSYNWLYEKLIQ